MRYMLLIYIDNDLLGSLPDGKFDVMMRECLSHADQLRAEGKLLDSQMLEDVPTARSIRTRKGKVTATDGPFAETKEVLGGFNLIEADSMDEAERIAREMFPWSSVGSIEVRPVRSIAEVRSRVGTA